MKKDVVFYLVPIMRKKLGSRWKAIFLNPWLLLAMVVLLWIISLQEFKLGDMKDWGLLSIFPVSMIVAYLLLVVGFASLFQNEQVNDICFAFYIFAFILMVHGTPQLLYGTIRYSWAWKHVGVVDYIIRHGAVDPRDPVLRVYHNWPGFFALNALFTQLAGFKSAETYAGWGPAFYDTLFAFSLLALFRLFTTDRRLQWLGVWFFLLTNWIGQDYFSPQATTYFMMIGYSILLLRGFGTNQPLNLVLWKSWLAPIFRIFRLPLQFMDKITSLKLTSVHHEPVQSKISRFGLGVIVLLVFGTIVSIHQLTPFMGVISVVVLILFGVIRWRTLPVWMILLIVLWLAFPAKLYNSEVTSSTLESFGKVEQTVDSGLVNTAKISTGQVVVSWMGRGLSGFIVLLAGLGILRRARKGYLDLYAILLAGSPVIVLFLNSYGGEALFRVYFFVIPFLSYLAAASVLTGDEPYHSRLKPLLVGGLSLAMLVAFLFAYYGKERQYSFTKAEVEAAEYLYSHAVPNSLLVEGSRNYPTMFLNYEYFSYVPIDREPSDSIDRILDDPVDVLYDWLSNSERYNASYLLLTRSQMIYTDDVGVMPLGSLEKIQTLLEQSDKFEVVFSNQDAVIFTTRKNIK
jgi:hypothetical protein